MRAHTVILGAGATIAAIPKGDKNGMKSSVMTGLINNLHLEDILNGIANFELTKRRMQVEKNNKGITIINDCYNANYDSMKAAIEYLGKINANRKIAVLGDMLELGEFSKNLHEKVGEEVGKNKIDILITVGEAAKDIAGKAKECGIEQSNIYEFSNNDEAVSLIEKIAKEGDAILIKASNGMKFYELADRFIEM